MVTRRAHSEAAKDERRQTILAAAYRAFEAERRLPTASRIADDAGLAKGTLYIYFASREAIFATLLLDRWSLALRALKDALGEAQKDRETITNLVINTFVTLARDEPILLSLDGMLAELKTGLSEAEREAFDTDLTARLSETALALEQALGLPPGQGYPLIVRSHAFVRGLWQSCDQTPADSFAVEEASQTVACEIHDALVEYWRGALLHRA